MNGYDKWLFVSDIDGTLNNKFMQLPENNRLAIERFVKNGGNFTLSSGRNLQSLTVHYKKLNVQTPAIFLNGAGIYDFSTEKMLKYDVISPEGEKIILDTLAQNKFLQLTVFAPNTVYRVKRLSFYGYFISKNDNLDCRLCKRVEDLPRNVWGKATFFGTVSHIKKLQSYFKNDENSQHFECFLTSPLTLEIVKKGVNKGTAVETLAQMLGISKAQTAAIGDYYNDVDMLTRVGHPACCGQAPNDIKSICEYVSCHCNDGAVADFMNYIENKYIKE